MLNNPHYAFDHLPKIQQRIKNKTLALFFDFDGTLTPIQKTPELVYLSDDLRQCLIKLHQQYFVAIISGRTIESLRKKIMIPDLVYAGNHGLEISDANHHTIHQQLTPTMLSSLSDFAIKLHDRLDSIPGVLIEHKQLTLSIHYRLIMNSEDVIHIEQAIRQLIPNYPDFRLHDGKKVFEVRPNIAWDKGKTVRHLLETVATSHPMPIYFGDDVSDEDAFSAIQPHGIGVLVSNHPGPSHADYYVHDENEVKSFLEKLIM